MPDISSSSAPPVFTTVTEKLIHRMDWASIAIGPPDRWPEKLRISVAQAFSCQLPMFVAWGPSLEVVYNDAFIEILGSKHPWAMGRPHLDIWAEARASIEPYLRRVLSGEPLLAKDVPFSILRDGELQNVWITFSFSPVFEHKEHVIGIQCVCFETTDKVRALAQYRESQNRLQLSLDASGSVGIWSVEPATNKTYLDERFAQLFQIDAIAGQRGSSLAPLVDMIHPEDRDRVMDAVTYAIEHRTLYDIEYRIPQKSGRDVWVLARGRIFGEPYFSVERFAGIAVDITRQKETELALAQEALARKKIEDELRQADQRKDVFLAMLAHELRNPLAPISASAQLIERSNVDDENIRTASAVISRQVKHMTGLVDDLLDVSRVTRGLVELDVQDLDVSAIVADAVEQARPLISAMRHELAIHLPAEPARVRGDAKRLVQVLVNLLNNAAKFTHVGGCLVVRVHTPQGKFITVSVQDNGIGMSADLVARAFELFTQEARTPDRSQGGLGIGLALVKSLIELHGGKVSATSEGAGTGSEFTVLLPRLQAQHAGTLVKKNKNLVTARPQSLRILVVDDNTDAAAMLGTLLEFDGHHVSVEDGSYRALIHFETDLPQVCILDIGMPGMDGNELARRLRRMPHTAELKLIALTGYGQSSDRERTHAAGFNYHLVKPVDFLILQQILTEISLQLR